ncbi:hypothetical protein VTK56DRAFT_7050 [Thermocarpiscus australiensis]
MTAESVTSTTLPSPVFFLHFKSSTPGLGFPRQPLRQFPGRSDLLASAHERPELCNGELYRFCKTVGIFSLTFRPFARVVGLLKLHDTTAGPARLQLPEPDSALDTARTLVMSDTDRTDPPSTWCCGVLGNPPVGSFSAYSTIRVRPVSIIPGRRILMGSVHPPSGPGSLRKALRPHPPGQRIRRDQLDAADGTPILSALRDHLRSARPLRTHKCLPAHHGIPAFSDFSIQDGTLARHLALVLFEATLRASHEIPDTSRLFPLERDTW